MKPGDLVVLSSRKTRKGMSYDDAIGVVTEVKPGPPGQIVTVVFDGDPYTFSLSDLEVLSEGM